MKKKWMLGVAAVAALALTGCGDTCDDIADADKVFLKKYAPCTTPDNNPEAFNINQCDANLNRCTDTEKEALAKFASCIRDLPECSPGNTQPFDDAFAACGLGVRGKVGQNCAIIFGN
jgi:hypothetical protein